MTNPELTNPELTNPEPETAQGWEPEVALVEPPTTQDDGVDGALSRLAAVTGSTLEEQLPVFEFVHRTLQDRLADVEG